jgi:hypothetical protein
MKADGGLRQSVTFVFCSPILANGNIQFHSNTFS